MSFLIRPMMKYHHCVVTTWYYYLPSLQPFVHSMEARLFGSRRSLEQRRKQKEINARAIIRCEAERLQLKSCFRTAWFGWCHREQQLFWDCFTKVQVYVHACRVYFGISLKRWANALWHISRVGKSKSMVGNPILNIGKANCQGGEGVKAPPAPPEINPVHVIYMYL